MTKEDKEDNENNRVCRFREKEIFSDKVGDHCRLTSKNCGPANNKCIINFT